MKRKFVVIDVVRGWDHARQIPGFYDQKIQAEQWIEQRPADCLGTMRYTVVEIWTNEKTEGA